MARVVVAEKAGACFGVERALAMAHEAAAEAREAERSGAARRPVHTLGPLIHNPVVVDALLAEGVSAVEAPEDAEPGSVLLMRAHGVAPEVERWARAAGAEVRDATCPFVKRVHVAAERLAREGYTVIIVGEAGHPEVEGTRGHAPDALVVGRPADLEGVELGRRVGLVVQTTLEHDRLRAVVAALVGSCEEVRLIDTICAATNERQHAAAELARQADVMVVVGGRNSANTRHLADICARACGLTHHIEAADELEASWFAGAGLVGLTAGASTPAEQIEAVREKIEELAEM